MSDILEKNKVKIKYFIHRIYRIIKYRFKRKKVFLEDNKKRVFVFLAADYGNIGDIAITYAQKEFLKENLLNYQVVEIDFHDTYRCIHFIKKNIKNDDIITIIGGGNMTNRYDFIEEARRIVIKTFRNNKIISFPQTIEFTNDIKGQEAQKRSQKIYSKHKSLTIFAREKKSFEKMKEIFSKNNVKLSPDIVMYLKGKLKFGNERRNKIGVCLRDDKEKAINDEKIKEKLINIYGKENIEYLSTHTGDENFKYEKRMNYFFELLENISKKEVFITDRLHGMIFCYLTNTPCLAFDNDNHKVSETYKLWIKDCNYIKLLKKDDINNIEQYIDNVKKVNKIDVDLEKKYINLKKSLN